MFWKCFVLLSLLLCPSVVTWGQTNYIIQKGDTLTRIASRHHVTLSELIRVNQIDPRATLKIGQSLIIPALGTNTVSIEQKLMVTNQMNMETSQVSILVQTTAIYRTELNTNAISNNSTNLASEVIEWNLNEKNLVPIIYRVKPGDNLFKIGKRFGTTPQQIAQWNSLSLQSILKIGQPLKIYQDVTYEAKPSEVPPKTEPLVLETPRVPVASPEPVLKPISSNIAPVKVTSNFTEKPVIKVAEVVKPAPPPEPLSKPEPVVKPISKPSLSKIENVEPPKKENSNYIFLQRVKTKIDQPTVKRNRWKYIVIHHSGTSQGSAQIFDTYHRKVKRMENGLAYHFVIGNGSETRDGEIEVGSRWMKQLQGGHLYSEYLNTIAIGICFVGDFSKSKPTAKQIAACIELVDYLKRICYSPNLKFCLHREINPRPTDCPGDRFPATLLHKRLD